MSTSREKNSYRNASSDIAMIVDAARSGDEERAYELACAAMARGAQDPVLFEIVASWLARHNRESEALAALESLRASASRDPGLLVRTGLLLLRLRRPQDALACFDSAIALQPDLVPAHYERGVALGVLGEIGQMRSAHEHVIALEPGNAGAHASVALIAARMGDTALARNHAARALNYSSSGNALAEAALAIADVHDDQIVQAQRRLDPLLADKRLINDSWMDIAISDAGDAFDRRNHTFEAFSAYAAVGERRRIRQMHTVQGRRAIDAVRNRTVYFRRSEPWDADPSQADVSPVRSHVFLLGFMRSGTTLLETVLASNAAVCAMDEREFLAEPARRFLFADETLNQLAALDEQDVAFWRAAYWRAAEHAGAVLADRVFVNKMPFNSLRLPLIAKLFPEARIILAVRDPRDVVLSCFRHRFDANHLTFEFLRLEDCARFYAATMELVELCRHKLPVRVHEHRYEDMIEDFDAAVRAVCEFVSLDWNENMRDFVGASGVIAPRSQSAAQVRRGLYSGGTGQWRRYGAQMAPVIPILEPWIERFGYPAD